MSVFSRYFSQMSYILGGLSFFCDYNIWSPCTVPHIMTLQLSKTDSWDYASLVWRGILLYTETCHCSLPSIFPLSLLPEM